MKRFISILLAAVTLCTAFAFADSTDGDDYYDDYVYEQNGSGDQFIKIGVNGFFPLNFGDNLYTGGAINIGYYRFISKNLAVGGETTLSYNLSIGEDVLYMAPFTFGVMFQPEIGKFEFPLTAEIGFGMESWANMMYFPAFAAKASAGAYFRINESFSIGAESSFLCLPEWTGSKSTTFTGLFATAAVSARFHF